MILEPQQRKFKPKLKRENGIWICTYYSGLHQIRAEGHDIISAYVEAVYQYFFNKFEK